MEAKLIAYTLPSDEFKSLGAETPEDIITYCARVSNVSNQSNFDSKSILSYCKKNSHWSVFEMSNAVVEVKAPRDITRQILRHKSFSFQEFSQRYSDDIEFCNREVRRQDNKNRQNSIDDLPTNILVESSHYIQQVLDTCKEAYTELRKLGVAKECARVVLPEGLTESRMYINGNMRSWIHYLDVRTSNGTQLEHIQIAKKISDCLTPVFKEIIL